MVWLLRTIRLVFKKPQTKEKNKMGTESAERNDEQTNTELAAVDNRRSIVFKWKDHRAAERWFHRKI